MWRREAACQPVSDAFFDQSLTDFAKDVCARCPVLDQCREWALSEADPDFGVVAGMAPAERRQAVADRRFAERWPEIA